MLRYLAQQHQVTLLAFTRSDDTPDAIEHLRDFCQDVITIPMRRSLAKDAMTLVKSFAAGDPVTIRRDSVPQMVRKVDELIQMGKFDAIHADQLYMAQYAQQARRVDAKTGGGRSQLVLDEHNAYFQIFQRLASGERNPVKRLVFEREWRALKRYEARLCTQFDHLVTVTPEDREILRTLMDGGRSEKAAQMPIVTIPICVDTQGVRPVAGRPGLKDVLHLGTMFWPPNIEGVLWFAQQVWPLVRTRLPEATFTIAGKNPPPEVKALEGSKDKGSDTGVRVLGYVSDPAPVLDGAGAFIVPLLSGGGMRVKIVDAWRWGLPVISTRIGAEGIEYKEGENVLIADQPADFADAVVKVLNEAGLAQQLRENGRRWVETHYEWRTIYREWDSVYPAN
ncbi:MAG TPA: glycosyltransferase family 4 protein [Anaerolineales bacterium]